MKDGSVYGARDAATLCLFLREHVGYHELPRLQYWHYDRQSATLSFRNGEPIAVSNETSSALDRWLEVRGSSQGPLINPVRRPNRVVFKTVPASLLGSVFKRRVPQAGVAHFTPDDVIRTRAMPATGHWFGRNATSVTVHRRKIAPDPAPALRESQSLVVRLLARCCYSSRNGLLARLDYIACRLSGGKAKAHTLAWTSIPIEEFVRVCRHFDEMGFRQAQLMRNALRSLVREGIAAGVMDKRAAEALKSCCPRRATEAAAAHLQVADIREMMDICESEGGSLGLRDSVLIGLLWETGLGISDLLALKAANCGQDVKCVHHPRGAERQCLRGELLHALSKWRQNLPLGAEKILVAVSQGGTISSNGMSPGQLARVLEYRGKNAGFGRLLSSTVRASTMGAAMAESDSE